MGVSLTCASPSRVLLCLAEIIARQPACSSFLFHPHSFLPSTPRSLINQPPLFLVLFVPLLRCLRVFCIFCYFLLISTTVTTLLLSSATSPYSFNRVLQPINALRLLPKPENRPGLTYTHRSIQFHSLEIFHRRLIKLRDPSTSICIQEIDSVLFKSADNHSPSKPSIRTTDSSPRAFSFSYRAQFSGVCYRQVPFSTLHNSCLNQAPPIFQDGCIITIGAGQLCPATSSSRNARVVIYRRR
jgi:hypothetical protein